MAWYLDLLGTQVRLNPTDLDMLLESPTGEWKNMFWHSLELLFLLRLCALGMVTIQRAQYTLIEEHTSNHVKDLVLI